MNDLLVYLIGVITVIVVLALLNRYVYTDPGDKPFATILVFAWSLASWLTIVLFCIVGICAGISQMCDLVKGNTTSSFLKFIKKIYRVVDKVITAR